MKFDSLPLIVFAKRIRCRTRALNFRPLSKPSLLSTIVLFTVLAVPGFAQDPPDLWPSSPASALFVPYNSITEVYYVPLSEFKHVDEGGGVFQITLTVREDIFEYITDNNSYYVARNNAGNITFLNPSYDENDFTFTVWATTGDYVVVSDLLLNDFVNLRLHDDVHNGGGIEVVPGLVTHWDATMNDPDGALGPVKPRGGQSEGASDCLTRILLNPETGALEKDEGFICLNSNKRHADPSNPSKYMYSYATDKYALFSDGTEVNPGQTDPPADFFYPDYNRFLGETYSYNGPTALAAIWLSDHNRDNYGYPIAHRNCPGMPLDNNVPVIQIAHAYIVDIGNTLHPDEDSENCLASFMIPPGWTDESDPGTYPTMVCGQYDIYDSVIGGNWGGYFLDAIYQLLNDPFVPENRKRAVGVIWNGGGNGVSVSLHDAALHNMNALMEYAGDTLKCDIDHLLFAGASRGGGTALAMAANPLSPPYTPTYTAKYVLAQSPQVRAHDSLQTFGNPTYFLAHNHISRDVGYKEAWRNGWIDPNTGLSARDEAQANLFGSDDDAYLDASKCSNSWPYITRLANMGVGISMRIGTHDYSTSITHMVEYVDRLRKDNQVNIHLEIVYGCGHGPGRPVPGVFELIKAIALDSSSPLVDGNVYYTNKDDGITFTTYPDGLPVVFQAPLMAGSDNGVKTHTFSLAGNPGTEFWVYFRRVSVTWENSGSGLDYISEIDYLEDWPAEADYHGFLNTAIDGNGEFGSYVIDSDDTKGPDSTGWWTYKLEYRLTPFSPIIELGIGDVVGWPEEWFAYLEEPLLHFNAEEEHIGDTVIDRDKYDYQRHTGGLRGDKQYWE